MYIDRRYHDRRRRRSRWPFLLILALFAAGAYLLLTRTTLVNTPLAPPTITPTATRTAASFASEAAEHYAFGRLAAAGSSYLRVTELDPANDEAYSWLARIWVYRGHPELALPMAQKAVEINGSALNLSILAMALDWNEKYDQAIQAALRAVDKDPMLPEAHAYLAEIYADRNNWLRALQESDQALKLDPNNSTVQRNRGYALEMQARYQEAIQAYDKAIALEPQLGYAYIGAGNCYRALNDFGNAISYYRKAIAANPDSPVGYDALGSTAAMAGDFDLALSSLRRATEIDPQFALGHAHLGKLYYTRYNYEASIESYKRAIDLGLDKEEHYYGLGLAYANLDMCKEALPWLNKALEANRESIPARDGLKACGR